MADQESLDLSITKDPQIQALLNSDSIFALQPNDPNTYRLFGLKSGEGSYKQLIPGDQINFGHRLLDALTGGRYLRDEMALGREQRALDAAIIAHQLGAIQKQSEITAASPPTFEAAHAQNPLAYQLSGIQPPTGQNVFPGLPPAQIQALTAAGVPSHILPSEDVVTGTYPRISAPLQPPQQAAYMGAIPHVPTLGSTLISQAAKQTEDKGPLAQLHQQRLNLEQRIQANPNDAVAGRDLSDVNEAIKKSTTITDQSPYLNVQADPLQPGKFIGLDKKTGQMVTVPSKVVGGTSIPSGVGGEEFLSTLPPASAAQVKALADGRLQFPAGFALKSPYWQNMLSLVSQYDPTFDAVNYNARASTRKAFTSGQPANALNALNTVMGHFDNLDRNLQSLNNSGFTAWNWLKNVALSPFNPDLKARLNRVNIDKQAVSSEMERAYRGTGGNLEDIKQWKQSFSFADSPQAMHASIQEGLSLLDSKIQALGDQYNKGMGTTKEGLSLLSPHAQQTFQRLSGQVSPAAQAESIAHIAGENDYQTLPSGTVFIGPDGKTRKKP